MNRLPEDETECEKWKEEEPEREAAGNFGAGFVAGMLAALLMVLLFLTGWNIAKRHVAGQRQARQESEGGAEILTDPATLHKLDEVQSLIEGNYLEEVDSELLSAYMFKGIAAGLDDVYASYYTKEELESVLDSSRGTYTGIGVVLSQNAQTKEIAVDEVYPGTPADLAGIREGDVLQSVDGTYVPGMELNDLVAIIKDREDSFYIEVYRPESGEELIFTIELGAVEIPVLTYEMKEDGIGYIRLTEFTESAVEKFQEAAGALQEQGMRALIVDLRDNPGGLLTSVCGILDEVLPEGLLVYTEDKDGNREEYSSDRVRTVDCEIAVLVNGDSASASEIFAGAIQDREAGLVIGTTTYGKGVVQKTFPLDDGSAFKMTVETYYTPLGQDIDGNGITPDIIVEDAEGGETKERASAEADEEDLDGTGLERVENDPVLERALEELRN